jgi:hypothetical protein
MMADRNGRNMLKKINECIVFKALCRTVHRTTITELHDKISLEITYSLRKLLQALMLQISTREATDRNLNLSQEANYSE